MKMIIPPFLKKGSTIGITCPAGYVSQDRVAHCVKVLNDWGFNTILGNTVGTEHHYFSGTDNQRRDDLQAMINNPAIHAILMGRGGYGTSALLDSLTFIPLLDNPKWICGFSDITALHTHLQVNYNMASLHSPMCGHFKPENDNAPFLQSFFDAITGIPIAYPLLPHRNNRNGIAMGEVIGGNLSLLAHVCGTVSQPDTRGRILFIEDIDEYLYHIHRMLLQMKRAGMIDDIAGLIVGGFTDIKDTERPFGCSLEELILSMVGDKPIPIAFGFPVGHQPINYTLCMGVPYCLQVTDMAVTMRPLPQ